MNILIAYFEDLADASGGLEKVLCEFANAFHERGHAVSIVTHDKHRGKPYYPLADAVEVTNVNPRVGEKMPFRRKLLREMYRLGGKSMCVTGSMRGGSERCVPVYFRSWRRSVPM